MNFGIDHVLIAVEDLDAAIKTYQELGFEAFFGGEHPNHGTHNALVPISGGFYLELIAVKNPELASQFPHTQRILGALERPNRYIQWALDTPDLDEAVREIRDRGIEMHAPIPGARKRSDGIDVAWRTAFFEDPRLPFLIQDITPRETRIAEPSSGLGQKMELKSILLGTPDVRELTELFAKILGPELNAHRGSIEFVESSEDELLNVVFKGDEAMSEMAPLGGAFAVVDR